MKKQIWFKYGLLLILILVLTLTLLPACKAKPAPAPTPAPSPKQAGPITFKFATADPSTSPMYLYHWMLYASELEARTKGRLKVELYPIGALGPAPQNYDLVRTGVADMCFFPQAYAPGRFPMGSIADLPFAFPSGALGSYVMSLLQHRGYFDKETADVKLLNVGVTSGYQIFTGSKKVTNLEDLKGLKLRSYGDTAAKVLTKLGATPVPMPIGETYTAIQTGTVDGGMFTFHLGGTFRIHEVSKYVFEGSLFGGPIMEVVNKDSFAKLSPEDQKIVEMFGNQMGIHYAVWNDYLDSQWKALFIKKGLEVTKISDVELVRWKSLVTPLYDEWEAEINNNGLPGTDIMKDFVKIQESLGFNFKMD